jgi:predicted dehydrogenase
MINWGIIGCGNVTEVKSGPAFNKVPGSSLVAVMRRNPDLAADYAERHNVPRFYSDADKLINDPGVNAVYVATPPGSHADYAIRAMKAGKPVYIEKPMAATYEECLSINRASAKYKIPVYVAYYRRTLPGFVMVRDFIQNGLIGKVRFVILNLFAYPSAEEREGKLPWRVDPTVAGGGHFFDLASHQLDYLDFLFGPVREIKALALNQAGLYSAEDFVAASYKFDENIVANGTWCFVTSPGSRTDKIEIVGEKGSIQFSTFSFENIVVTNSMGTHEYVNERPEHVQYYLIEQVVNALSGKGTVSSTGETAARTSRVLDESVSAYYRGSKWKKKL